MKYERFSTEEWAVDDSTDPPRVLPKGVYYTNENPEGIEVDFEEGDALWDRLDADYDSYVFNFIDIGEKNLNINGKEDFQNGKSNRNHRSHNWLTKF